MYSITVAFTQEINPDFVSRCIMKILGTNYSHVLMVFEDIDGKEKILHAISKGTDIDEEQKYLETHKVVKAFRVPMRVSKEVFAGYARGRVGRDYAESHYLNMLLEKIGIKWVPFKDGKSEGVCSGEIAAAAFMTKLTPPGLKTWDEVASELVDPKEVELFLAAQPLAEPIKLAI